MTVSVKGSRTAIIAIALASLCCNAAAAQAPITQDQVKAGREDYQESCASCHGDHLAGNGAPALSGPTFRAAWATHTSAELYKFIQSSMPYCEGGILGNQAYDDIVAFILRENGAKPGDVALTPDMTVKIGDIIAP